MNILCLLILVTIGCEAQEIDTSKIRIFLWTRENPDAKDIVALTEESLASSHFNPGNPTKILAHGWNSNGRDYVKGFGDEYKDEYLAVGDFNVFSIDWGDLESWTNYFHAAAITKPVAQYSAQLVQLLSQYDGVFENIHLVGHSLGAHVVGFIAKEVQAKGLGKLSRVTGLEPAFPSFELAGPEGRIDKSDAEFVQIIHTNSGFLWEGCLSFKEPLGHVDFYPSGGSHQPGCTDFCSIVGCSNLTVIDLLKGGCSHNRASLYMSESILGANGEIEFVGRYCPTWEDFKSGNCCENPTAVMGEWANNSVEGSFYLYVEENKPHAMGDAGANCV